MGNTDIILVLKSGRTTRRISSSEIRYIHCEHPICDLYLADEKQVDFYKANPAIKDGETMTLDEAIWNIEALFNLTYAYPELSYGHTIATYAHRELIGENVVVKGNL